METEIWKDIPWYEWLYQVSNLWNIKSLPKKWKWWHNWKIMKLWKDWKWYLFTKLYNEKKYKNMKAHILVMLSFKWCSNWKEVNHIDWNKENNRLENLEYVTKSENIIHAFKTWLNKPNMSWLWKLWILNKKSKKVWKFDNDWNLIEEWFMYDFNIKYWYDRTSIVKVCNRNTRQKTAYWFNWKYI